jgi:hypothetical protein
MQIRNFPRLAQIVSLEICPTIFGVSIFRGSVVTSILCGLLSKDFFTEDGKGPLCSRTAFSSYDSLSEKLFAFSTSFNPSGIA